MGVEAIRELLRRQPFEPFEINLSSGEKHPERHPEQVALENPAWSWFTPKTIA